MYPVSQEFIDEIKADERQVFAKLQVDYTSPFLDQSISVEANETANASFPSQTADSVAEPFAKIASLDGSWVLNGTYALAPTPQEAETKQMGWWGKQLAGTGGAFSTPYPTLTVTFFPRPITKLQAVGDSKRQEWPVDFNIKLYDGNNTLLHTETVTGNTQIAWSKTLAEPITQVEKMTLEITKWSHAGRQAKILEFFTSIQEVYEGDDIILVHLLEEREVSQGSLPVGNISANEIDIRLNNETRKFDAGNKQSPLYQTLKANRRIKAWLGIEKNPWLDFVPQYNDTGTSFNTNTETIPKDCILYMDINGNRNTDYFWYVNGEKIRGWLAIDGKWVNRTISVKKGDTLYISGDGILATELRDTMILRLDDANGAKVAEFDFVLKPPSCYLTTVMVGYFGKDDDGIELNSMRALRSHSGHKYQDVLDEYCRISPLIIQGIERTGQQNYYYSMIKDVVDKIVAWVANEEWEKAEQAYLDLYYALKATFVSDDSQVAELEMVVGQKATVLTQVELETLDVEWVPLGTFWSGDWNVPEDEVYAATTGRDRLELLRKSTYSTSQVQMNKTLYDLAQNILTDAGLTEEEYYIDPELKDFPVPYAWFDSQSHREALRKVAEACLGQVYCDRNGIIRIEGPSFLQSQTEPVMTITQDDYFRKDNPVKWSEIANYVEVETQPLRPDIEQEVYHSNEPVSISAGQSKTITAYYNHTPCIEATATLENAVSGAQITKATYYAWGADITVTSTNTGTFELVINAKPLKVLNKEKAIAKDDASITDNGKLVYNFPANPLVQTREVAQKIADTLLAYFKNPRRDVEVEWRGNPALLLGDKIAVVDKDETNEYYVTKQELEFDGALRARMSGRRA